MQTCIAFTSARSMICLYETPNFDGRRYKQKSEIAQQGLPRAGGGVVRRLRELEVAEVRPRGWAVITGPTRGWAVITGPTRGWAVITGHTRGWAVITGPTREETGVDDTLRRITTLTTLLQSGPIFLPHPSPSQPVISPSPQPKSRGAGDGVPPRDGVLPIPPPARGAQRRELAPTELVFDCSCPHGASFNCSCCPHGASLRLFLPPRS
eukprot:gene8945-biopygen4622